MAFALHSNDATRYISFIFGLVFWQTLSYFGLALSFISGVYSWFILSWDVSNLWLGWLIFPEKPYHSYMTWFRFQGNQSLGIKKSLPLQVIVSSKDWQDLVYIFGSGEYQISSYKDHKQFLSLSRFFFLNFNFRSKLF